MPSDLVVGGAPGTKDGSGEKTKRRAPIDLEVPDVDALHGLLWWRRSVGCSAHQADMVPTPRQAGSLFP
jgi:hypothetical protein